MGCSVTPSTLLEAIGEALGTGAEVITRQEARADVFDLLGRPVARDLKPEGAGLEAGHFDVVLTDVNMPKLNGYELAKELRRQGCSIPIIGATANAMRGEEELCLAAGMNRCLVKPFALQALFNCLAPYQGITREAL